MDISEFIKNKIFELPKTRTEEYFPKYINSIISEYQTLILSAEGELKEFVDQNRNEIYLIGRSVIDATEEYFAGNTFGARKKFYEGLEIAKEKNYLPIQKINISYGEFTKKHFFRGRCSNNSITSRKEMFHPPFEKRGNLKTSRYSIPGLPCLYLSNRIYNVWEENGRPDTHSFYVSYVDLQDFFEFLFFGFGIYDFRLTSDFNPANEIIKNYLAYFPIHLACSIKTLHPEDIFKPEYIFPQFIMEWVKDIGLTGIQYSSARYSPERISNNAFDFYNYAIPIQISNREGYCLQLQRFIKLTEPITWQMLMTSDPNFAAKRIELKSRSIDRTTLTFTEIESIPGKKFNYLNTIFGRMEEYLIHEMPLDFIDPSSSYNLDRSIPPPLLK